MKFKDLDLALTVSLALVVILTAEGRSENAAEGPSVARPDPQGMVEWVRTIYADGAWNGTPDITHWRGVVATEDGVYVVYYSGHTYGETAQARNTKADIYLAKLNIGS